MKTLDRESVVYLCGIAVTASTIVFMLAFTDIVIR